MLCAVDGLYTYTEEVTLRTTVMRHWQGELVTIPNGTIRLVENFSRIFAIAFAFITVSYDADLNVVNHTLNTCVRKQLQKDPRSGPFMLQPPCVDGPIKFTVNAVVVRYSVRVKGPYKWQVERTMCETIKNVFDEHGIAFATNRHNVNILSSSYHHDQFDGYFNGDGF